MHKGSNPSPASYRYVSLIIVVYTIIIILILFWAAQVFNAVIRGTPLGNSPAILISSILIPPVFLSISSIIWVKFFRRKRQGIPGYRLKLKLTGLFTLVVISAILLSGLFPMFLFNTSFNLWLSPENGLALEASEQLSSEYRNDALNRLRNLAESDYLSNLLDDENRDAGQVWRNLLDVAPYLDAIQIVGGGRGRMMGRFELFFPPGDFEKYNEEGALPERKVDGQTVLYWQSFRNNNRIVLTSALIRNFEANVRRIVTAHGKWQRLDWMRGTAKSLLGGFVFLIISPLILIALFAGIALSDMLVSSLTSLGEATRRVSEGNFSFRIPDSERSELDFLTEPFNQMISGLSENHARIIHDERLATWQMIAQRLAHELRNPLTPIKLSAQRILRKVKDGVLDIALVQKASGLILREVNSLDKLLQDFRNFAGGGTLKRSKLDVEYLITHIFERFRTMRPEIEWLLVPREAILPIMADARQIERVITNLITNALEANSTRITIEWNMVYRRNSPLVYFAVLDNGEGIPPERSESIFQPYNSTRERSVGLGLALAQRIVYDHHGRIWFESEIGKGTAFHVELPAREET